jgi:hypothetical protein
MNLAKYQCLNCKQSAWTVSPALWKCEHCGHEYPCVRGVPKLYLETHLGKKDVALREYLYNGFLGRYYMHVMPFLSLPVRPAKAYWKGWVVYGLIVAALVSLAGYLVRAFFLPTIQSPRLMSRCWSA